MSDEENRPELTLSEMVRLSRQAEIQEISNALVKGENVYITGKFVTGKSTLGKEILRLAGEGRVWDDKLVPGVYTHALHFMEDDEIVVESLKKIEGKNPSLLIVDEISRIAENKQVLEDFIKRTKELNSKGVKVIVVGGNDPETQLRLKEIFPAIIAMQEPPKTMKESDLRVYREANETYEDDLT